MPQYVQWLCVCGRTRAAAGGVTVIVITSYSASSSCTSPSVCLPRCCNSSYFTRTFFLGVASLASFVGQIYVLIMLPLPS